MPFILTAIQICPVKVLEGIKTAVVGGGDFIVQLYTYATSLINLIIFLEIFFWGGFSPFPFQGKVGMRFGYN